MESLIFTDEQKDLKLYYNDAVADATFTITEKNTSNPYDFTGFTDVNFRIYKNQGDRTVLAALVNSTNLTIPTPTNGKILLNYQYSEIDLTPSVYWYDLKVTLSGKERVVSYGLLSIV